MICADLLICVLVGLAEDIFKVHAHKAEVMLREAFLVRLSSSHYL